ncbi:MAG: metal ABC transporter permease [Corynebacterium sp.]|nr:metal ABC transporter permease [Corynebacterium sp.]
MSSILSPILSPIFGHDYLLTVLTKPLIEVTLIGILAGLVGTIALLTRHIFFSESITHSTFPGAVLGVVIAGNSPLAIYGGAALMCIPFSWLMHRLAKVRGLTTQAAAAIVLTFGFALGYFLNKWFAPLPVKVDSFLSGSLLSVSSTDLMMAATVLVLVIVALLQFGSRLIAFAFEPESLPRMRPLVLVMIVATVVIMIPAVGTILSLALLVAPAAIARMLVSNYKTMFLIAPIIGVLIGLVGLFISVQWDLSSGGSITVFAGVAYVLVKLCTEIRARLGARIASSTTA